MKLDFPVAILCGGLGTRLREETEYKPKPMVEIGGRPIVWHIMKLYAHYGFHRFILCLGYKGSVIKDYFLNYEAMSNDFTIQLGRGNQMIYQSGHTEQDFSVTLVDTGLRTMTGGRIKRIERFAIILPLRQYRLPAQTCLRAFKDQKFKQHSIIVDQDAPFLIVVRDVRLSRSPGTTRHGGYRHLSINLFPEPAAIGNIREYELTLVERKRVGVFVFTE